MGKPEAAVEEYLKAIVEAAGGQCYKFISGVNGVPDRIVVAGSTVFVEVKAPGGAPEEHQVEVMAQLAEAGADVRLVDSRADAAALIRELTASITDADRARWAANAAVIRAAHAPSTRPVLPTLASRRARSGYQSQETAENRKRD